MALAAGMTVMALSERADQIERRIETVEDRNAILRLLIELQSSVDGGDSARAASLFSEDGEWSDLSGQAIARDHISDYLGGLFKLPQSEAERSYHSISDVVISLNAGGGTARGRWRLYCPGDGRQAVVERFGDFDAVLTRTTAGWKIERWASNSLLPYIANRHQRIESTESEAHRQGAATIPAPTRPRSPSSGPAIEQLRRRLDAVSKRIHQADDFDSVYRLFLDVQTAMDERDLEEYGQLYTSDGEWCAVNGRAIGPENITTHLKQYCKPWESEHKRTFHSIGDVTVDLADDVAKGRGQWQHYHPGDDGLPVIRQFGHFEAVARRTPDGWRFMRRASYATLPFVEPKCQLIGLASSQDDFERAVELAGRSPEGASLEESSSPTIGALRTQLDLLDRTLQLVEDRAAIFRQFIKLQDATDSRDGAGYGACFTEDGEWSGVSGKAVGRAAIVRHMNKFMTPWESNEARTFHSISDAMIDVEGDTAMARVQYRHYKLGGSGRPIAFQFCHYDAVLTRTPDGWLFKRRASHIDIPYIAPKFQVAG
jgi:ketosteroid isomerase-like protein